MVFLLSLDRRGGREWSGRRKSRLLTPSVRLGALSKAIHAGARRAGPRARRRATRPTSRSDRLSECVRRGLQTLADVGELSRREVDAFLLRFRAGSWLSACLCWLSARSLIVLSWRSIAATVRVSPANWPAMLAMSASDDTPARVYAENLA